LLRSFARSTEYHMRVEILRFAKLGDALIAVAISRSQYSLGISSEQATESLHKFLKSRRGGSIEFRTSLDHDLMLTIKALSDGRDESAPAVEMT
jgi:hypothetical protein